MLNGDTKMIRSQNIDTNDNTIKTVAMGNRAARIDELGLLYRVHLQVDRKEVKTVTFDSLDYGDDGHYTAEHKANKLAHRHVFN